jgi:spore protease
MISKRTDLAVEAREIWKESAGEQTKLPGVQAYDKDNYGVKTTVVKILNKQGEKELCKPIGSYITLEIEPYLRREEHAFENCVRAIAEELRKVMKLSKEGAVLVVGLGNEAVTPDAIGPKTTENVMVTRHLKNELPEEFSLFRGVSAMKSGVLGTTGIESAELIRSIVDRIKPECIIAVDALTSRNTSRICRTIQISNTGIVPGSGVGNGREALCEKTVGASVIAIGVPTVVDAATLAVDIFEKAGKNIQDVDDLKQYGTDMIVTPKDIDSNVKDVSKLIGYGINLALHDGITVEDVDMFIS